MTAERTCIRCGCTDSRACAGGCAWVSPAIDICTACAVPVLVSFDDLPRQLFLAFDAPKLPVIIGRYPRDIVSCRRATRDLAAYLAACR